MPTRKILLIEDNTSDIALTKRALDKAGILNNLTVVEDGREALDYFFGVGAYQGRDPLDSPELTLLDLKLPKISGLEVLRQLRAHPLLKRIPVVILTSSNEEEDRAAGYDLGVNSYIRKPVDFTQFTHCIQQLGLYWLVMNEPPPPILNRPE